jgi:hypothetical protein
MQASATGQEISLMYPGVDGKIMFGEIALIEMFYAE